MRRVRDAVQSTGCVNSLGVSRLSEGVGSRLSEACASSIVSIHRDGSASNRLTICVCKACPALWAATKRICLNQKGLGCTKLSIWEVKTEIPHHMAFETAQGD